MSFNDPTVDVDMTTAAPAAAAAAAAPARSPSLSPPAAAGAVGADGSAAAADEYCTACPRRFRNVKGKRHGPIGAQICQKCYDSGRRGEPRSASASASSVAARSHKKKAVSEPGKAPLAAKLSLQGSIVHHFATHLWRFAPPERISDTLATSWGIVAKLMKADRKLEWQGLHGGSRQLDLLALPATHIVAKWKEHTISHGRLLLEREGVDRRGTRLHVAAMKLLRLPKGLGPQRPHYDAMKREEATQRYSFLLYCNEGMSTFEKLFPRKKMTLVMDNAAYHNPAGIHTYRPSAMDAAACVSFFSDRSIRSITVPRDGGEQRMTLATFRKRAPHGPNRSEKQAAVRHYLKSNPGVSLTQTDEILQPGGHEVLWTVPYTPELQPIELLWARVKNKVATQALLRRSTEECRQQAGKPFDDVSADDCAKLVGSVHGWITNFMRNDTSGSLRHFESFADLVARGPAELPAELNIPDSDSDASDSDNDEGEAADMELD